MLATNKTAKIYTITQLNTIARMLLEENLPLLWVEGELSNLAVPSSGHIYFSLKDELSQVRCAMFRKQNLTLNFTPKNGMHILAQVQVSIYEPRGDYQLIVNYMEEAGDGVLRRKFEDLKNKLAAAGLFASDHKKPLPKFPKQIGVITSPTGAAIQDIISVLKRRAANIPIIIYPTLVQGDSAAKQIAAAITLANQHNCCDVLILARGGGSLEDLWPFNEEIVARSIFASNIPIVTGIGHEIDFTIADFTADQRAPTPSAAAELISPDTNEYLNILQQLQIKLAHLITNKLKHSKLELDNLTKRLQHPGKRLQSYMQQLDHSEQRIKLAIRNLLKHKQSQLINLTRTLETISPLATLSRGYAIATIEKNGKILLKSNDAKLGAIINLRLYEGSLNCTVDKIT